MKTLIAYFSVSGVTAKVARELAEQVGADLYEITPEVPYTEADLNWRNPLARCNKEFLGKKNVPVCGKVESFDSYERVLVGFPIWYGAAPNVVSTFCAGYDWAGKEVLAFATSGGSPIGKTAEKLTPYVKNAEKVSAVLVKSTDELKACL